MQLVAFFKTCATNFVFDSKSVELISRHLSKCLFKFLGNRLVLLLLVNKFIFKSVNLD